MISRGGRGWALLVPLLAVIAAASVVPFLAAFRGSFLHDRYGIVTPAGLENYRVLFTDRGFALSFLISAVWAVTGAILSTGAGYVFAVYMRSRPVPGKVVLTSLLVPWGLPVFVAVPLWRAMIYGSGGTSLVSRLTGFTVDIFTDPAAAFISAMAVNLWMMIPLSAFALYAAMAKTPQAMLDAAVIDGADRHDMARYILRPGIRRTAYVLLLLGMVRGLKEFTLVYIMTSGGPPLLRGITERGIVGATTTLGVYVYELFTETEDLGLVSAYTVVLTLAVLVLAAVWYLADRGSGAGGVERAVRVEPIPRLSKTAAALLSPALIALFIGVTAVLVLFLLRLSLSSQPTGYIDRLIPSPAGAGNYVRIFTEEGLHRAFANTAVLAVATGLLLPLVAVPAAAYVRFRKGPVSVPAAVQILGTAGGIHSLIPLYIAARTVGLVDTYVPVVLTFVNHALPFALLALYAFLKDFPESLFDAAMIDGAGPVAIAVRLILPLSAPVVSVVAVFGIVSAWNGFTPPLVFLHSGGKFPVSLELFSLAGSLGSGNHRWGLFAAAAVVNVLLLSGLLRFFRKRLSATHLRDL